MEIYLPVLYNSPAPPDKLWSASNSNTFKEVQRCGFYLQKFTLASQNRNALPATFACAWLVSKPSLGRAFIVRQVSWRYHSAPVMAFI